MKQGGKNSTTHDRTERKADRPPRERDTIFNGSLILDSLISRAGPPFSEPAARGCHRFDDRYERQNDVGERVHQHDEHTRPEKPVPRRRCLDIGVSVLEGQAAVAD